jgi:hypothetical protein
MPLHVWDTYFYVAPFLCKHVGGGGGGGGGGRSKF